MRRDCQRRWSRPKAGPGSPGPRTCEKSGAGILPVGLGGIGILPMIHGLEAHATLNRDLWAPKARHLVLQLPETTKRDNPIN